MRTVRCSGRLGWGVSPQGVCVSIGCLSMGGCPRGCTPPPVNRITDRCKNITYSQLRLRTVKINLGCLDLFTPNEWKKETFLWSYSPMVSVVPLKTELRSISWQNYIYVRLREFISSEFSNFLLPFKQCIPWCLSWFCGKRLLNSHGPLRFWYSHVSRCLLLRLIAWRGDSIVG